MTISSGAWDKYIKSLRKINDTAAEKILRYLETHALDDIEQINAAIDYALAVTTQYGEAAAALSCQMYDAIAEASGVVLDAALPAPTATVADVARTINGIRKTSENTELLANGLARLVKMAAVDTTMQNAIRDGAEWAWIPRGDTCAFCITLASNGWQVASRKALKNGHAEHIHANCDCTYAIRFNDATTVAGYDPDKYLRMYEEGAKQPYEDKDTAHMVGKYASNKNINGMRRMFYQENKKEINAQKRDAYAKRKELESDKATETDVGV